MRVASSSHLVPVLLFVAACGVDAEPIDDDVPLALSPKGEENGRGHRKKSPTDDAGTSTTEPTTTPTAGAAALTAPGPLPLVCVPPTSPHFHAVYALPSKVTDRSAAMVPRMKEIAMLANAFMASEARAAAGNGYDSRFVFDCDADGTPNVEVVQVDADGTVAIDFDPLVTKLKAKGLSDTKAKYWVFYDGARTVGAGQASSAYCSPTDPSATCRNQGLSWAIEGNWRKHAPHLGVFLHETGHTMGAVMSNTPNSSGSGHCNDGWDVMCYADGGPTSKFALRCADRIHYDCGYDDYFNPAPAAGTFLASHWNIANPDNAFLRNTTNTGDSVSPTAPTNVRVVSSSSTAVTIAWDPASDGTLVGGYMIVRDTEEGKLPIGLAYGSELRFVDRGVQPFLSGTKMEYRVLAYDAVGNFSVPSTVVSVTLN